MDTLAAYKTINNSFKKEFIFHLGAEMGFYSEFNNMVFAMLYCLKYEYKFILFSGDANFKIDKGWQDFFKPFCEESNFFLHGKINRRTSPPDLSRKYKFLFKLYRLLNRKTFLTYELWDKFFNSKFEKEIFNIPQLGINGSLKDASRVIVGMIYQFNDTTKNDLSNIIAELNLPKKYLSVNIRRGDKDTEFKFIDTSSYINKLKEESVLNALFVFTDDYTVIENIKLNYQEYNVFSLVDKNERGYVHNDFLKLEKPEKRYYLIKMFAAIEVVCAANYSVGTYTTNPGLFFGMRMAEGTFYSVQKSSWYQFEMDDIKEFIVHHFISK